MPVCYMKLADKELTVVVLKFLLNIML